MKKISPNAATYLSSLPIVRPEPGKKIVPIRTQARSATILPNFVGLKFQVYNGKVYHDVIVTEDMVGHKLGEFSPSVAPFPPSIATPADPGLHLLTGSCRTRKPFIYSKK